MSYGRKGFKDVKVCISYLRELQASGALDPRQKERLDQALAVLRRPNQRDARGHRDVLRAVRVIVETLWEAFGRRK